MKRYAYLPRNDGGSSIYDIDSGEIVLESVGELPGVLLLDHILLNEAKRMTMAEVLSNRKVKEAVLVDCWKIACSKIERVIKEAQ